MVNRRIGKEDSETRLQLLEAAEGLLREGGYASLTSRKLAEFAGLKPQLVHYYFRKMDDLFEAVFERVADRHLSKLYKIAELDEPLVPMFELSCDAHNAVQHLEFLAMANHRKHMQTVIAKFGQKLNEIESEIIRRELAKEGIDAPDIPPEALSTIFETMSRGLAFGSQLNRQHYENARAVMINWLSNIGTIYRNFEDRPASA